jgi:hypothetical protein
MGRGHSQAPDEQIVEVLRASRPDPSPEFLASLEATLFVAPAQRSPRQRPVLVGAFAAAGVALAALVLSLAGVGPLAASQKQDVKARTGCDYVAVKKWISVPSLVRPRGGEPRIVYREQLVERQVKRCDSRSSSATR